MKVLVVKDSVIYQGQIYKTNTSFDLDDVLAKELIKNGIVVAYGNEKEEKVAVEDSQEEQKATVEGEISKEMLEEMKYQELKKLASDMGLDASGKKEELIERISKETVEVEVEAEEEEEELPNTSMPE